jgi:hypothetical protein
MPTGNSCWARGGSFSSTFYKKKINSRGRGHVKTKRGVGQTYRKEKTGSRKNRTGQHSAGRMYRGTKEVAEKLGYVKKVGGGDRRIACRTKQIGEDTPTQYGDLPLTSCKTEQLNKRYSLDR